MGRTMSSLDSLFVELDFGSSLTNERSLIFHRFETHSHAYLGWNALLTCSLYFEVHSFLVPGSFEVCLFI